jgi:hypothetical protein
MKQKFMERNKPYTVQYLKVNSCMEQNIGYKMRQLELAKVNVWSNLLAN